MRLTTETKIIGIIITLTIMIIIGGVFLFPKQSDSSVPTDQIVAEKGLHWHPKLEIYVKGQKQEIPAKIGLGAVHGKIHTHTEDAKDGVIHMEMSGLVRKEDTKLGKFFLAWGKDINFGGNPKMTVNGKENMDLNNYLMKDGDNIEIRYE